MRLLLVRHGPSAHVVAPGLLSRADVARWRLEYDAAGILEHPAPPSELLARVADADVIVASDLPRAVASASRLAPNRTIDTSELFREFYLRMPEVGRLRLPLGAWELLIHLRWELDILLRRDLTPAEERQLRAAADWCDARCRAFEDDATVVVVTHGAFRRALARQLTTAGWTRSEGRSYANWSAWELASPRRHVQAYAG